MNNNLSFEKPCPSTTNNGGHLHVAAAPASAACSDDSDVEIKFEETYPNLQLYKGQPVLTDSNIEKFLKVATDFLVDNDISTMKVQLFNTKDHGKGIRSQVVITPGEIITGYFPLWAQNNDTGEAWHNYIFVEKYIIPGGLFHLLPNISKVEDAMHRETRVNLSCVDPLRVSAGRTSGPMNDSDVQGILTRLGLLAQYANDGGLEPDAVNAAIVPVGAKDCDKDNPELTFVLVAIKEIKIGEEILIDYGIPYWESPDAPQRIAPGSTVDDE